MGNGIQKGIKLTKGGKRRGNGTFPILTGRQGSAEDARFFLNIYSKWCPSFKPQPEYMLMYNSETSLYIINRLETRMRIRVQYRLRVLPMALSILPASLILSSA